MLNRSLSYLAHTTIAPYNHGKKIETETVSSGNEHLLKNCRWLGSTRTPQASPSDLYDTIICTNYWRAHKPSVVRSDLYQGSTSIIQHSIPFGSLLYKSNKSLPHPRKKNTCRKQSPNVTAFCTSTSRPAPCKYWSAMLTMASGSPRASSCDKSKHVLWRWWWWRWRWWKWWCWRIKLRSSRNFHTTMFPQRNHQTARDATWNSGINPTDINSNFPPSTTQPTIPIPFALQETTASSYQGVVPSTTADSEVLIQNTKPLSSAELESQNGFSGIPWFQQRPRPQNVSCSILPPKQ